MNNWKTISEIRREYGDLCLEDTAIQQSPIQQFKIWFDELVIAEKFDPTAMVLSTVNEQGHPDSRVVLLKGLEDESFYFYTNYLSTKALQLDKTPFAALNFYWPHMSRQVRIRGSVERLTALQSDTYFSSRPLTSQLAAIASPQSQKMPDRESLKQKYIELINQCEEKDIRRPAHWGGYRVIPAEIEFWQGRNNRLHDRVLYYKEQQQWNHCILAP